MLGNYCDLPPSAELATALYDGIRLRDDAVIPAGFQAPATWLVLGMMNYDGRLPKANKTIDLLAQHYNVEVDEDQRARHVRVNRVAVVRFDSSEARFQSVGVER